MNEVEGNRDADVWWAELSPAERVLFRDMLRMVEGLEEGEILKVSCVGQGRFVPVLKTRRGAAVRPAGNDEERFRPAYIDPEVWWEGLSPEIQAFMVKLGCILQRLLLDPYEAVEFSRVPGRVRAEHVLNFRRPCGGMAAWN
jgi:hypothetical protein